MADTLTIQVNTKAIEDLGALFQKAGELAIRRLAERGEQLLRKEAPVVTSNLRQGVSSDVEIAPGVFKAELIVSARAGRRGARKGTVHYPSGSTKAITLRSQPAFDYAEAVATGTGIYGPKKSPIKPKRGRTLLIPLPPDFSLLKSETYIEVGGEKFIYARQSKGRRPNPYDQRALAQLDKDAGRILDAALNKAGLVQ